MGIRKTNRMRMGTPSHLCVVVENPEVKDLRRISELLIRTYESSGMNKTIEFIDSVGAILRDSDI